MLKNEIKKLIKRAVKEKIDFIVEIPENKDHGDYSTNIAMLLAIELKKAPMDIVQDIKAKMQARQEDDLFEKIEIIQPGFINFFIKPKFLQKQLKEILKQGEKFGEVNIGKGKKVQVEFVSANPTGPLTVGNARGGPIGDVLANVLAKADYKVEKEYYVNDAGRQIEILGHSVLKDKEAKYKGKYIDDLAKTIKDKNPRKVGEKAAKIIVNKSIKKTTDKLGIKFDNWFFESELYKAKKVEKIITFLAGKKLLYEKDGATWFKSSKFGDNRDRVLIKKNKEFTYLAGDIAYHYNKLKERNFDRVINIWGADHHGDVPGLQAGVEAIGFKGKLEIILVQFVGLIIKGKAVRMSKREGNFIEMDDLLKEVGPDIVRFFFLMNSVNRHLNFDLELAKEKSDKNPVFYVQYAHARIHSILVKSKILNTKSLSRRQAGKINPKYNLLKHPTELELIKELIKFPEIVEDTAKDYQIQRLPHYALELAASFHKFYNNCRVLGEKKELENARLGLLLATKIVLKNTLNLIGVTALNKM